MRPSCSPAFCINGTKRSKGDEMDPTLLEAFLEAIALLPTGSGGRAVIAVVDSTPPAVAMLATGSVYCADEMVRLAVESSSSFAAAQGRSATLLTATDTLVLRVSIAPLTTVAHGSVSVVSGPIVAIRPSVELPWSLSLSFVPSGAPGAARFVEYWRACRAWLRDPSSGPPPERPTASPGR